MIERVTTGFVGVRTTEPATRVAATVRGVVPSEAELERLLAGGIRALPHNLDAWSAGLDAVVARRDEHQAALVRLRREMVEVVVPSTIVYLSVGACLALATLAVSFLFPDLRMFFFPAAGCILLGLVGFAVVLSVRSAAEQQRIHDEMFAAHDALENIDRERRRLPALASALGLVASPDGLTKLRAQAGKEGWAHEVADPDRPLVVVEPPADALAALEPLGRARLIMVLGERLRAEDYDEVVEWADLCSG